MSSVRRLDGIQNEGGAPGTLGDLLYANAKQPIPESEWAALVASCAAKDPRALHALYQRTSRLVFTLSQRIVGDRLAAEEVTLDVYHEVWLRSDAYDAERNTVIGWMMNLTRSRAIDRLRFDQRKKRTAPAADSGPGNEQSVDDSVRTLEARDDVRILKEALQALTAAERQAIETAFFSELTYVEAAARLNQPLGTLKTRIRAGLAKLRQALNKAEAAP
jgi:RNA polymerase sigma-70 factor (ECF subfamily)